jgi:hypothetical protein
VLVNPADATNTATTLRDVEAAARAIGLQIKVLNAKTSREIDAVFHMLGHERPDALFVGAFAFFNVRRVQLVQLAAFHRFPAAYALREAAEAGGLMSYDEPPGFYIVAHDRFRHIAPGQCVSSAPCASRRVRWPRSQRAGPGSRRDRDEDVAQMASPHRGLVEPP